MRHRKDKLYDNCVIQDPDGTPLCRCLKKRLDWYLDRGLATRIDDNTIRLYKYPSGNYNIKEATQIKDNICVVCGSTLKLTIHHVVPYCFRHAMPLEWRASQALYHDTVALCNDCHKKYEIHGNRLKRKLADQFNIHEQGYDVVRDNARQKIRTYARILLGIPPKRKKLKKYKKLFQYPHERRNEFLRYIADYIDHEPTQEELMGMTSWEAVVKGTNYIPYGKYIVDKLGPAELVLMWRKHFLDTMNPKFMPSFWSLERLPTKEEIEIILQELKDDPKEIRWQFYNSA